MDATSEIKNCLLDNKCLTPNIIHEAQITNNTNNEHKKYLRAAETPSKERYSKHTRDFETSFKERYSNNMRDFKHKKYL